MKKQAYLNPKQRQFVFSKQKTKVFLGGRGSGKSHVLGTNQRIKMGAMPRSKGFLASTTYNQILTKTLPAIISAWQRYGLIENVHYVIGVKPPKWYDSPISPPKKYSNVISLMNGRCVEMISLDRPDLARGGSYDDGDIDEAALLKKEDYTKILLPSIRGNTWRFSNTHLHQQISLYTSMPWKSSGYWIFDYEELAQKHPDLYLWLTANAYDNIHILTEAGIERMRRELPYTEFMVEVMNERIIRVDDCFYNELDRDKHCYTPEYQYGHDDNGKLITIGSNDYDPGRILETSWDFGGWFNCCEVYQAQGMTENMINSFHAGSDQKLQHVVDKLCDHYSRHENRLIRIWGEPRGHDRLPSLPSLYEQLEQMLRHRGWETEIKVPPGYATRMHEERREFINTILDESDHRLPKARINEDTCKSPIIAMESTQTTRDGKKDKSKEKDRSFPQENATHYTDGFDYYFMQKHGWRVMEDAYHQQPGDVQFI
ncbi:MAG: hypothetical protein AAFU67_08135 [Bacteroidota bacterium]